MPPKNTQSALTVLERLYDLIDERRKSDPEKSYIAKRLAQGTPKIAQKLGEEAVETIIAAMENDRDAIVAESADMLFHWLLLLADHKIEPKEVMEELVKREGTSGIDEKARRKMKK